MNKSERIHQHSKKNKILTDKIMYEEINCALCGENNLRIKNIIDLRKKKNNIIRINGIDYTIDKKETIVECQNCGLIYVNPRILLLPKYKIISNEQDKFYFEETRNERISAYSNLIKQIPTWLGQQAENLLDIGCGDGVLIEAALKEDITCTGIEQNEALINFARERLQGSFTIKKDFNNIPGSCFDVITLINVIEHLTEPAVVLNKLSKLLKPKGILLIHTPNVSGIYSRILSARWHHYEPLVHFYYFNINTLTKILENSGMDIIAQFNITASKGIKTWLQKIFLKMEFNLGNGFGVIARLPQKK